MNCINLKERFGRRYRVTYEESYYAEHGPHGRVDDAWLMILLCHRGHIFPWGGDLLAASLDVKGPTRVKLAALDCATVVQDGDDGLTVTFQVEAFDQVAELLKPRRRHQGRVLAAEEREKLVATGKANLERVNSHRRKVQQTVPERVSTPQQVF